MHAVRIIEVMGIRLGLKQGSSWQAHVVPCTCNRNAPQLISRCDQVSQTLRSLHPLCVADC